eukprot:2794466-Alexandrium_andersonii.AAC.1
MAGFGPHDKTYRNADEACQAVAQMRATKTLEWARNRREGMRLDALREERKLRWRLANHNCYRSWK